MICNLGGSVSGVFSLFVLVFLTSGFAFSEFIWVAVSNVLV